MPNLKNLFQKCYILFKIWHIKFAAEKGQPKKQRKKRKIRGKKNEKKNFNCDFGNYDVCDPGGKCLC